MIHFDFMNATLEDLRKMSNFGDKTKKFNSFIIVPMDEDHDSGYRAMKLILMNAKNDEIVGVIGGGSDVINLDGIGGYGLRNGPILEDPQLTPRTDWSIDCLPGSGCLRVFVTNRLLCLDTNIICSSIEIFTTEKEA